MARRITRNAVLASCMRQVTVVDDSEDPRDCPGRTCHWTDRTQVRCCVFSTNVSAMETARVGPCSCSDGESSGLLDFEIRLVPAKVTR